MNGHAVVVFIHLEGGDDPVRRRDPRQFLGTQDFDQYIDGIKTTAWFPPVALQSPEVLHGHPDSVRLALHSGFGCRFKRSTKCFTLSKEQLESSRVSSLEIR